MSSRGLIPLAAAAALLSLACGSGSADDDVLAMQSGTSFGFCPPTSYCATTLELTPSSAVLIKTSRAHGDLRRPGTLTTTEWADLVAGVDEEALRALPAVIGCPDCADGGAEWIEVTTADWTKRVTFEHGQAPPALQGLMERVRRIRSRLDRPEGS